LGLLLLLAVSRYDATSYLFRGTDTVDFFNWFWRHRFGGVLTFFDLLLAGLVALALASAIITRRWPSRPFDLLLVVLLVLCVLGTASWVFHRQEEDTLQGLLYQLRNYGYLVAACAIASRVRWDEPRRRFFGPYLGGLALLTIALSRWELGQTPRELLLWKYGRYVNVRDLNDYLLIFFLQFWVAALLLDGLPRRWWLRVAAAGLLGYSLLGVFTGIGRGVLVVYPLCFAFLAWHYRVLRRRWFAAAVGIGAAGLVGLGSYVLLHSRAMEMESPLYIYTTFTSREAAVATRGQEATNFAANLYHRNALLTGIGVGNKWYEYVRQPPDLGAFPASEWDSPWHLGMHLPFVRILLDFGLLGGGVLIALFAAAFLASLRALRTREFDGPTRALVVAAWIVVGYQLVVNNLAGPKTNLIAGVLLGAIAGILHDSREKATA
jgi:hypothetical protein